MPLAFVSGNPHKRAMPSRKVSIASVALAIFAASASSTYAATGEGPWHPTTFGEAVLATFVFGLIGIVLAIIGFKLFDLITPFNLEKEMCENKNVAVGILCGGIVLGICWIVAASMS